MQNVPDPYRLLGVGRDASLDQIKAAHRRLAKRYHPDAPGGNRSQFLAVQEAYQLLADPLRRRQWDARHAAGPLRADDQPGRVRPRPANGAGAPRGQRSAGAQRPARGAGYTDGGSTRTWSARGVPWWEEGESARARRPPGTHRPREADAEPAARSAPGPSAAAGPSAAKPGRGAGARGAGGPRNASERTGTSSQAGGPSTTRQAGRRERTTHRAQEGPDFDVYSRSSGAAWSSAARAYFRRGVDDLPRGRASWATRPRPRRSADAAGDAARTDGHDDEQAAPDSSRASASTTPGYWGARGNRASSAGVDGATRTARDGQAHQPTGSAGFGRPPATGSASGSAGGSSVGGSSFAGSSAAGASVAGPSLGTAPRFTSQGPHGGLARARRWAVQGRGQWPPLFQRLVFAVAGWLPPALALAYTSGNVTGCDRAAVSCPPNFEMIQFGAVAGLLGLLVVLPRAAYLAAAGSAGLAFTAALLVIVYSVAGVAQPLPQPVALLTVALWLAGYVIGAFAAANDWPVPRPWSHEAWLRGAGGAAPSLGVARRVSRSRLGGR